MLDTTELDTTTAETPKNGWQSFDDDQAFLRHILAQKPAEEIVEIPEWHVKVLCRALNAETRIKIQVAAYDERSKRTDYRNVFAMIVLAGCFNPTTQHKVFTESHRDSLMKQQDGGAVERIALAILRISSMIGTESSNIKKN